jgi:thiol-disulfide isomerase/thioredoxin
MICSKCGKDLETKYFSYRVDKGYHRTTCRFCTHGYKASRLDKTNNTLELFQKGLKICSNCKEIKTIDNYNFYKKSAVGLASWCNTCRKEHRTLNIDKSYIAVIKRKYGISEEEYIQILKKFDNKCGICSSTDSGGRSKRMSLDHCHKTGKIRGILCHSCNTGLGLLKDSTEILQKAIDYLESNK